MQIQSPNHYSVEEIPLNSGMLVLKSLFPGGVATESRFVLFSTSGVHGSYETIEGIEESFEADPGPGLLTFLIIEPRTVCIQYGQCFVYPGDIEFLKRLRASSHKQVLQIGM